MPEVNGVWLNAIPNAIPRSQKEIAAIQKKAAYYSYACRAVDVCISLNQKVLIGSGVIAGVVYSINKEMFPIFRSLDERSILLLKDSNSTSGDIMTYLGGGDIEVDSFIKYLGRSFLAVLSLGMFSGLLGNELMKLRNSYINKHNDCIDIIVASNKLRVPDYEDMQCYDQIAHIDKTNVGPISCTPVEEIEQKVFYRGEVYEYYYLLTAYTTNPNGRDHTGQPYDISQFYRIDDNNIQYTN
jgi:hypothetical protein